MRTGCWTSCRGWSGEADDPAGFVPRPEHAPLVEAQQRYGHYRVGRTEAVFEALAPACIEQVVTGKEAFRAWRLLVREFGEPAPGPASDPDSAAYGMYLPPTPEAWSRVPSWRFLAAGVEQRRSRTLVRTAVRAPALERTLAGSYAAADRALRSFPGVGAWTSAEVRQRAHGDPDAWSVGDYHVGQGHHLHPDRRGPGRRRLHRDPGALPRPPVPGAVAAGVVGRRRPRRAPRMTLPTHTPYATGASPDFAGIVPPGARLAERAQAGRGGSAASGGRFWELVPSIAVRTRRKASRSASDTPAVTSASVRSDRLRRYLDS